MARHDNPQCYLNQKKDEICTSKIMYFNTIDYSKYILIYFHNLFNIAVSEVNVTCSSLPQELHINDTTELGEYQSDILGPMRELSRKCMY